VQVQQYQPAQDEEIRPPNQNFNMLSDLMSQLDSMGLNHPQTLDAKKTFEPFQGYDYFKKMSNDAQNNLMD
jgi:hypothetical protein